MATATMEQTQEQQTAPEPVKLRTRRDYSLTVQALESRAAELAKLAKKTQEEGYTAESRIIASDAGAITEYILPRFRAQQELPLVSEERVRAAVKSAFHAVIHRFAVSSDSAQKKDAQGELTDRWQGKREEDLAAAIARGVEAYAIEIAEAAYAAGYAAREMTPAAIALRSTGPLYDAVANL